MFAQDTVIMGTKREHERGDRVKTKTDGSPSMVVDDVYQPFFSFRYSCKWTDENGVEQLDLFRFADLIPAA
ncbi:MAG: hypothetical protein JWO38_4090 [Gemmataceae bacterium]|nr:hypothetical protein [Gemmataceae bacterium]